jgi:hypothetical protein
MGIVDWLKKREVTRIELLQDTVKGIFALAVANPNDGARINSAYDAQKKWGESMPTMYGAEIAKLSLLVLGSDTPETIAFFKHSEIAEFEKRVAASRPARRGRAQPSWYNEPVHDLTAMDHDHLHSFTESVEDRRLDQRLYYMNADSADVWHRLINAGDYRQYDWCRESLRVLIRSEAWAAAVADGTLESIVMLGGGGSASKDVEMLSALVEAGYRQGAKRKTRYLLLDISQHMLSASFRPVKQYFRREPKADPLLTVRGFVADMMSLGRIKRLLRESTSRNAWFITGGTIGNCSEKALLTSIERAALPGDLLAVGIDTYDSSDRERASAAILEKYRPEMMHDFLRTPVGVLVHHLDRDLSPTALRSAIKPVIVNGKDKGYSDIRGALTAEVRLDLDDDDAYTLLTSTRYDQRAFTTWLEARGWETLGVFTSPDPASTFRQVLARRLEPR